MKRLVAKTVWALLLAVPWIAGLGMLGSFYGLLIYKLLHSGNPVTKAIAAELLFIYAGLPFGGFFMCLVYDWAKENK